jgi:DNA-binding protein
MVWMSLMKDGWCKEIKKEELKMSAQHIDEGDSKADSISAVAIILLAVSVVIFWLSGM